jgi:hypothetical protein
MTNQMHSDDIQNGKMPSTSMLQANATCKNSIQFIADEQLLPAISHHRIIRINRIRQITATHQDQPPPPFLQERQLQ